MTFPQSIPLQRLLITSLDIYIYIRTIHQFPANKLVLDRQINSVHPIQEWIGSTTKGTSTGNHGFFPGDIGMPSNFSTETEGQPCWRTSSSSLSATVEFFFVPAMATGTGNTWQTMP